MIIFHGNIVYAKNQDELTVHRDSYLVERMEETGLYGYIGKVNMDTDSPEYLCETPEQIVERFCYLGETGNIRARYLGGEKIG